MASMILRDGREADVGRVHRYSDAEMIRARHLAARDMKRAGVPITKIARHYRVTRQTIYNWLAVIPADAPSLVAS